MAEWGLDWLHLDNDSLNVTLMDEFCDNLEHPALYIFTLFVYSLVCVGGLVGNSLVIYVILRFSKMQSVTNMYIINLAVADECFLIGIPFLIVTMLLHRWVFGSVMCKIYMTITSVNQFTSSIFLTILSADRYVAVCHPLTAVKLRTPFVSKVVTLLAWSVSAVLMIPVYKYAKIIDDSCNIYWPEMDELSGQAAFTLYSFVLGFALPLSLIFCFYTLVMRKLHALGTRRSMKRKRTQRKVTRLVLAVIAVYAACWLPYWLTQLSLIFAPPMECQSVAFIAVFVIAGCCGYCNSAMNPILFALLSENFKKSFTKAFACSSYRETNAVLRRENSAFGGRSSMRRSFRRGRRESEASSTTDRVREQRDTSAATSKSTSTLNTTLLTESQL